MITTDILTAEQKAAWDRDGYVIVPGLFSPEEVAAIRDFFDAIGQRGERIPGHWEPKADADPADVLQRWPRVMHLHRREERVKRWMLHPGIRDALAGLLDKPAVATQSMFYFKPPGAKGQALHQDNFYLQVKPDTCVAAWLAVDPATPANGGMYLVPGTHNMPIACPEVADASESFTTHLVKAPKGMKAVPAIMNSGDVLFFNGSVVHGSGPNRSPAGAWRRAFICHYMPRSSTHIHPGYFPVLDFDGTEIPYEASRDGGPCGEDWSNVGYH